jgi:hypothetical protein
MRPSIFDLMVRVARSSSDTLQAYRTDLWLHDQYRLVYDSSRGDEFIWILRDAGTELFRLYQGDDPGAVDYWLSPTHRHNRAYHVVCTDAGGCGTLTPITAERAVELASLPQRGPLALTPRERQLLDHLKSVVRSIGYADNADLRRAQELVDRLEFTTPRAA